MIPVLPLFLHCILNNSISAQEHCIVNKRKSENNYLNGAMLI
jgi:hypothetical protein